MVFVISNEAKNILSLSVVSGTRQSILQELLSKPDVDLIVLEDDVEAQSVLFDYLGIKHKFVIGIPGVKSTNIVMYITDAHKLIDYQTFEKDYPMLVKGSSSNVIDDVFSEKLDSDKDFEIDA